MSHTLPSLPYSYDALEPYIDARTMEIHHTKHHQAYVDKLNAALASYPDLADDPTEKLIADLEAIPEDIRQAVRNHGGGHVNHSFFWQLLKKNENGEPLEKLGQAINETFGSFDNFKKEFTNTTLACFGSGWAWLSLDQENKLIIHSTPNQDSPLMIKMKPIIGLDVWEHAYYLNYQNKRPDYIAAFWNIINWEKAERNFEVANS